MLAGLSHPGLVMLFDAALDAEPAYLTMEYVIGETLAERLRRGPLPPTEAAVLVIAIAEALAFVHARGIVHRDIKPGNILQPASTTGTGGPAKLADFGIARLVDGARVTATGSVMGTAAYISPEQASGQPASPASDIYALGIVLIECLTAQHPFPGTALESASARLTKQPDLGDERLVAHRDLLSQMTALDPVARPTAAEVLADLAGVAPTRVMAPIDAATVPISEASISTAPTATTRLLTPSAGTAAEGRTAARRGIPGMRWIAIAAATLLAAALVVVAVVALAAILPGLVSPRAGDDPAATYPAVAGELGIHLEQLQDAVNGTDLEEPVLATTEAAADGDFESALGLLDAVSAFTARALSSGEIDADRAESIDSAISAAKSDLTGLLESEGNEPSDSPGNSGNGNGNGNGGKKNG
ncbi:MAG: serine/threonine-protein kinase [Pseudolysinimonas sp.]